MFALNPKRLWRCSKWCYWIVTFLIYCERSPVFTWSRKKINTFSKEVINTSERPAGSRGETCTSANRPCNSTPPWEYKQKVWSTNMFITAHIYCMCTWTRMDTLLQELKTPMHFLSSQGCSGRKAKNNPDRSPVRHTHPGAGTFLQ